MKAAGTIAASLEPLTISEWKDNITVIADIGNPVLTQAALIKGC